MSINIVLVILTLLLIPANSNNEKNWTLFLNQGNPLKTGLHPYLVIFIQKNNDLRFGFSNLICSGTILNQRWIITRANPLSSYAIGSYYAAAQLEITQDNFNQIQIDYVAIHPQYSGENDETDMVMVKTTKYMHFYSDLQNINTIFNVNISYNNCKLITWSMVKYYGRDLMGLMRSQINLTVKSNSCPREMYCFDDYEYGICGFNSGAPLICDFVFAGIFIGYRGKRLNCQKLEEINTIRINQTSTLQWLELITSTIPHDTKNEESLVEKRKTRYRICNKSKNLIPTFFIIFLTIINLI